MPLCFTQMCCCILCLQLNALVYVGNGRSREVIRTFEFGGGFALPGTNCSSNRNRPYNFEVLITTYELVLKDAPLLSKINWAYMMVDEAHRLKNSESALYQVWWPWQPPTATSRHARSSAMMPLGRSVLSSITISCARLQV